jgi:hypothetical protein
MDGQPATFDLFFKNTIKTNGGYMFDLTVTFQVGRGRAAREWGVLRGRQSAARLRAGPGAAEGAA